MSVQAQPPLSSDMSASQKWLCLAGPPSQPNLCLRNGPFGSWQLLVLGHLMHPGLAFAQALVPVEVGTCSTTGRDAAPAAALLLRLTLACSMQGRMHPCCTSLPQLLHRWAPLCAKLCSQTACLHRPCCMPLVLGSAASVAAMQHMSGPGLQ